MKKLFIVLITLLMLAGCSTSDSKIRVGVIQLTQHDALDAATNGFVDRLKEEFKEDIDIDVQNASGDSSVCGLMANNFVAEDVDLILCNATPALQATVTATSSIPILGTSVTEYGTALRIDNFSGTVGGNISGTSDLAPLDQQADMILELLPNTKKVGILYCSSESNSLYQANVVEKCLKDKGIEVEVFTFDDSSTLNIVVNQACEEIDCLYIPTDNTCADNGTIIAKAANDNNVPIVCGEKSILLNTQGLATLSIDYYELGKTTAEMAIKILKGEKNISEMPIEYYANPVKIINQEKAKEFNVVVPQGYVDLED